MVNWECFPCGIYVGKDWDHNITKNFQSCSSGILSITKLSDCCIKLSNDASSCTHHPYGGSPQTLNFSLPCETTCTCIQRFKSRESHEKYSASIPRDNILGTVYCPTRRPCRCDVPAPLYFYPDFYPDCDVTSLRKGIFRTFSLTKSQKFSFKRWSFVSLSFSTHLVV